MTWTKTSHGALTRSPGVCRKRIGLHARSVTDARPRCCGPTARSGPPDAASESRLTSLRARTGSARALREEQRGTDRRACRGEGDGLEAAALRSVDGER